MHVESDLKMSIKVLVIILVVSNGAVWTGRGAVSRDVSNTDLDRTEQIYRERGNHMNNDSRTGRIYGGRDTSIEEHPWQVSLQKSYGYNRWYHACGGSILSKRWLVTAAHCLVKGTDGMMILAGVTHRYNYKQVNKHFINKFIVHKDYRSHHKYDIALIQIEESFDFSNKGIRPIEMIEHAADYTTLTDCSTTGWGQFTNGNTLDVVDVPLISLKKCIAETADFLANTFGQNYVHLVNHLTDKECAGYNGSLKGICKGDSGGPLTCRRNGTPYLMGATSFYYRDSIKGSNSCLKKAKIPSFYTSISFYHRWICKHVEDEIRCNLPETKPISAFHLSIVIFSCLGLAVIVISIIMTFGLSKKNIKKL